MSEKKVLLNDYEMNVTIERLCQQLIEKHDIFENTVIIGIQPRGIFLSNRLVTKLNSKLKFSPVKSGCLDISFHRDDLRIRKNPIIPKSIDIDFNVEENIALPLILNGKKFNESIEEANKLLEVLGISDRNKFKPNLLSGGEQQRVAVARALIKKPLLILADEPTGSLDDENSSDVLELILKMSKINNSLCIVATHNLKLINNLDFCMKIEEGQLVENRK